MSVHHVAEDGGDESLVVTPLTYRWSTSDANELNDCVARLHREVALPNTSIRCVAFDLHNVQLFAPHLHVLSGLKGLSCVALLFDGYLDLGPLEDVFQRSTSITTLALHYQPPPTILPLAGFYQHVIHHLSSKTSHFPLLDDVTTLFLRVDGFKLDFDDLSRTLLAFGSRLLPKVQNIHVFDSPGELPEGELREWIRALQDVVRAADDRGPKCLARISWGRWIIHRQLYRKREYTFDRWDVQDEVKALTEAGLGVLWGPIQDTMY